ncbi:hypothetical protein L9G15_22405, partial [Shewanella sp. A3A]|nr:hypothetical protein [Shewanella ferrihydritica]
KVSVLVENCFCAPNKPLVMLPQDFPEDVRSMEHLTFDFVGCVNISNKQGPFRLLSINLLFVLFSWARDSSLLFSIIALSIASGVLQDSVKFTA